MRIAAIGRTETGSIIDLPSLCMNFIFKEIPLASTVHWFSPGSQYFCAANVNHTAATIPHRCLHER